jgi:hypothetical protein
MADKHYVTFLSPGTFMAEDRRVAIGEWDTRKAVEMAGSVTERYGAHPYGFYFSTTKVGDVDGVPVESRETAKSGMYFIGCAVETLEQIEARQDPRDRILLSNMRGNGWSRVVTTTKGWRWTQPLSSGDTVLDADGNVVEVCP